MSALKNVMPNRHGRKPIANRDLVKTSKKKFTLYYSDEEATKKKIDVILTVKGDHSLSSLLERLLREEYERSLMTIEKERELLEHRGRNAEGSTELTEKSV